MHDGSRLRSTLTTGDLVELFGVSRSTIHRWAIEGRIPSFKTVGGHNRFRASDIGPMLSPGRQVPPQRRG